MVDLFSSLRRAHSVLTVARDAPQDTTSMVFTKQYGFRFSSCKYRELAPKQAVLELDFAKDSVGAWRGERRQRLQATTSGTVHAVLASWEVYDRGVSDASHVAGEGLTMSTHPDATLENFPRDMQWGQGLQVRHAALSE